MVEVNTRSVCRHRLPAVSRSFFCCGVKRIHRDLTGEIDRRLLYLPRLIDSGAVKTIPWAEVRGLAAR